MAIYSLNLGFISRSEGRSAVGFSAYISRSVQRDDRIGIAYAYAERNDVIVSRVLLPEGALEWMRDPSALWNAVEQFEDHCATLRFRGDIHDPEKHQRSLAAKETFLNSAQTAQTIMGAIPRELTPLEAEACVEEFLKDRFVSRGLVVEYAIHWDEGNPHFHGLITRRPLVEGAFSLRKDRDIVSKPELFVTRKQWEDVANKYLALGGHEVRIDSRSYADQGLSLLPTYHEGWYAQRLAERGEYSRIVADNDAIRQKNIEILCENPTQLIHELTLKRTIFTRQHIEEEILRRVGGDEKLFILLKAKVEGLELPSELVLKQANDNREIVLEGTHTKNMTSLVRQFTGQLVSNEEIISRVGENLNREPVFTSAAYKQQEDQITEFGDLLHHRSSKTVSSGFIEQSIKAREKELGFSLSEEQRAAILHLCSGPDIRILNGKAGTGKTTLLKAVAGAYQEAGFRVLGTSFQGKAVEIMEKEIGIPCKTLDSFKYAWEKHQNAINLLAEGKLWGKAYSYAVTVANTLAPHRLTNKDIIIVDEANMVGNPLWEPFLKEATSAGAKVLIVQDPAQIKSRAPGDTGRLFAERFGFVETREVVRQRVGWQRECAKLLNDHQVLDGLKTYEEKGHILWQETETQTLNAITQDYIKDYLNHPQQSRMALAYRNRDVYALNCGIRDSLKSQGHLQEGVKLGGEEYAIGDRIRFTQNDHYGTRVKNPRWDSGESISTSPLQFIKDKLNPKPNTNKSVGVKNGTFGVIEKIEVQELTVTLEDQRRVQFSWAEYPHIAHGYAMGIHKSEGSTFDKSFVVLDPLMDPSTLLVGLTRHREGVQVYVNREDFVDFKDLVDRLGRPSLSQTIQDYQISEEKKPAFERVQQYRDLIVEASTVREEIEADLEGETPFHKHQAYPAYQTILEEKKRCAADILKDWQFHAPYIRLAGIRKDVLECEVGLRPRLLSDLEQRAAVQVQGYMDLVRETRELWKTISATHPGTLAQSHALYEEYKAQKTERDSLASIIQETLLLYAPFFKVTRDEGTGELRDYWGDPVEKGGRVYLTSVKLHAAAHTKAQLQSLFYDRLSPEQRGYYDEVKAYVKVRNNASSLYSHLKKQDTPETQISSFQVTSSDTSLTLETFRTHQAQRDALALKIVESPALYQEFFTLLNIKEEKLLDHAVAGELREKAITYVGEQDIAKRAEQAQELKRILRVPQDYRIVNEVFKENPSVDMNRLTFDIAFYNKMRNGELPSSLHPDEVYKPIQNYLKSSKEAAQLWKSVQLKGQETPNIHQEYEAALQARNENAKQLRDNQPAFGVLGGMGGGLQQRVVQQATQVERGVDVLHHDKTHELSAERVLEASQGRIPEVMKDLLGEPNRHLSSKTILRFGSKGSLVVNLSKGGLWKDFESGEGGNIFQLIGREKGLSFKESVAYLAEILNITHSKEGNLKKDVVSQTLPPSQKSPSLEDSVLTAKDRAERLNAVSELQMKSQPIAGTPAETYLREERGIKGDLSSNLCYLPKGTTFMYHDERKTLSQSCLAAFGRGHNNRLSSVQLIKLTETGERALTAEGDKLNKIQYGIAKGSFVCVQEDTTHDRVFIAEGLETALSLKEAGIKGKIVASMGVHNIINYQGGEKEIVLCGDNDAPRWDSGAGHKDRSQTHTILEKAQAHFKDHNKSVSILKPAHPGNDFNDVLQKQGIQGVQDYLKPYLDPEKQRNVVEAQKQIQDRHTLSRDTPGHKSPEKAIGGISRIGFSPATPISSSVGKEHSLEIITDYIQIKLKDIKAYAGTSLAEEAHKELTDYLHTLQKNEPLFEALKVHNKELSRDLERTIKEHEHLHIRGRGLDLGM